MVLVNEKENNNTKCMYFECFHILIYQKPKLRAKLALCGKKKKKKMSLPEKCLLSVFERVRQ